MASTRSRTPRPSKRSAWEKKFMPILRKHHAHFAKKVFHRLMNKSSSLRSGLRRRSKEYEVEFSISLTEIRELLFKAYGRPCYYCKKILNVSNMVCDHKYPISSGGDSTANNLQMICAPCNTKKGPLEHEDFKRFLRWVRKQPQDMQAYILRKMSTKEVFR